MKLKKIEIELQPSYAANAGKYIATIQYVDTEENELKLVLSAESSDALVALIQPTVTEFSGKVTKEL